MMLDFMSFVEISEYMLVLFGIGRSELLFIVYGLFELNNLLEKLLENVFFEFFFLYGDRLLLLVLILGIFFDFMEFL